MRILSACAVLAVLAIGLTAWAQENSQMKFFKAVAAGDPSTVIVAVAGSENPDPKAGAIEATKSAIEACQGQAKGLVVFEDPVNYQAVVAGVMEAGQGLPMIGVHAESLITQQTLPPGNSLSVMAIGGEQVRVQTAEAPLDKNRRKTAESLVKQLKNFKDPKMIWVLSEPDLSFEKGVTVEDFLFGMKAGFGKVPIFGGNCKPIGDQGGVQFIDGKTLRRSVVSMAISGPFKVLGDHTTEFVPLGKPLTVTKADGKWVEQLDGKPAAQVYREIRGMKPTDKFTSDSEHPIGVVVSPTRWYNRMVLEWRPKELGKEQDLRFITAIPEGTRVQVMGFPGTSKSIVDSAAAGVKSMLERADGIKPVAVFASDCCARGFRIKKFSKEEGVHADEITQGVDKVLGGEHIPVFGFYAYGEIGPIRGAYEGLHYEYQQHTFVGLMLVPEKTPTEAQASK